jgi:hypothetical protein
MEVYNGYGTKFTPTDPKEPAVVIVSDLQQKQQMGLVLLDGESLCGFNAFKTQIDGTFIILEETTMDVMSFLPGHADPLFGLEVSQHSRVIHGGLTQLEVIKAVTQEMCQSRKKAMINALYLLRRDLVPHLEGIPTQGVQYVRAGSVVYVIQCQKVYVTYRPSTACFHEIPVTLGNDTWFLNADTLILQPNGTEIPCSQLTPVRWKVDKEWWCSWPQAAPCGGDVPIRLVPRMHNITVQMQFDRLGFRGFSTDQIQAFNKFQLYKFQRDAVMYEIGTSTVIGRRPSLNLFNLFNDAALDEVGDFLSSGWFSWLRSMKPISTFLDSFALISMGAISIGGVVNAIIV